MEQAESYPTMTMEASPRSESSWLFLLYTFFIFIFSSVACIIVPMSTSKDTNSHACSACKFQRRRCVKDCPLAPYFPGDKPEIFRNAHRLYGVTKMINILKKTRDDQKEDAMKSIIYESNVRAQSPVHGCLGFMNQLQSQVRRRQEELRFVNKQLAVYKGQPYYDGIAPSSTKFDGQSSVMSEGVLPSYYQFNSSGTFSTIPYPNAPLPPSKIGERDGGSVFGETPEVRKVDGQNPNCPVQEPSLESLLKGKELCIATEKEGNDTYYVL